MHVRRDATKRATTETIALTAGIVLCVLFIVFAFAKVGRSARPRSPTPAQMGGAPALPPVTRAALDAGNKAYRAHQFALALGHYRLAALSAPSEAAPYFGIFMAAQALHDTALADSALAGIRARSGSRAFSDSAVQALHGRR